MSSYILLTGIGYATAIVAALLNYKKLEPRWLRLFIIFIAFEYFLQVAGRSKNFFINGSNYYIVNIQMIVSFLFYLGLYGGFIRYKKLITFFGLVFLLVCAIEIILIHKSFLLYLNYTSSVANLLIVICCFIYLTQLLTREELINYFKVPMFWITLGILISILGVWLYLALDAYIKKGGSNPDNSIDLFIFVLINNVQYALFTIGFLCNKKWIKAR